MKIGIVAGETSGDLLGAELIHALRKKCSSLQIEGIGGPSMIAAGCRSFYDLERLSVMGFIEPLKRLPELIRMRRHLYQHFTAFRPDVFIGIDAPDFNLGLELKLRAARIRTVHYVSPSVWAWRQKRIHKIAKAVDLMLTLFPFEKKFYDHHRVPASYVGHPLADKIPLHPDKLAARRALGMDVDAIYIALLPGSRRQEIRYMAETFLLTAQHCWKERPHLRFITSHTHAPRYAEFEAYYKQYAPDLPLEFFRDRSHDVMAAADVVLVGSGTATLETMLYKRPMVIVYRTSAFAYQIARYLVKVSYIGLPNLLADQLIVPEFIQDAAQPEPIAQKILDYLDQPQRVQTLQDTFTQLHQALRMNSSQCAAEAILRLGTY